MSSQPVLDQFKRPLRDLRISVTDRCNFRCPYCMPAEVFHERYQFLARQRILTFEEITRLTRNIVSLGAVKLRLTGGEPLVRQNIERLVAMLTGLDGVDDIAMTTNGVLLPEKVHALRDAGLQRLTVSLDSLDDAVFRRMNGNRAGVDEVLAGVAAAQAAGFSQIKINCVVQRGFNDDTLVDLARWCRDQGHILRFIEYMDVGTMNGWQMQDVVPAKEIAEKIHAAFPIERVQRNYASETALRFRYQDGAGEIGIIASVTLPFCGDCSRMRLSPEGSLYTCLFANEGLDLKTPMRDGMDDTQLTNLIASLWEKRVDRYSEIRSSQTIPRNKIEMYYIGG